MVADAYASVDALVAHEQRAAFGVLARLGLLANELQVVRAQVPAVLVLIVAGTWQI